MGESASRTQTDDNVDVEEGTETKSCPPANKRSIKGDDAPRQLYLHTQRYNSVIEPTVESHSDRHSDVPRRANTSPKTTISSILRHWEHLSRIRDGKKMTGRSQSLSLGEDVTAKIREGQFGGNNQ